MNTFLTGLIVALVVYSTNAIAADTTASPPSEVSPPSAPSIPLSQLLAPTSDNNAPTPVMATLNDGSTIEFDADGTVWVINAEGKNPAPDGVLTLKDGTPFVVKGGKRASATGDN